ncbi:MAG: DUF2585 family protein [Phycisphaeraceae bacterium]
MNDEQPDLAKPRPPWAGPLIVSIALAAAGVVLLRAMGRDWWCDCGTLSPWSWDVWSMHNSQHLVDPYTLSHVLHGLIFYGVLSLIFRGGRPALRFCLALALQVTWEVVENTDRVIQRYREETISLNYYGDSILNSLADVTACMVGYTAAGLVPVWISAAAFVVVEAVMLVWIRDSLLLNVLMLFWPVEAIKQWQMGGMP